MDLDHTVFSNSGSREHRVEGVIYIRNGEHVSEDRGKEERERLQGREKELDNTRK